MLFFYWILELFRQWYILFFYWILELFRQCGIFCFCTLIVVFIVVAYIEHLDGKTKNKIYHTVGKVPKSNRKTKYTTLSDEFQNLIEKQKNTTVGTVPKSNRKTKSKNKIN
jgi:hypothetical protein